MAVMMLVSHATRGLQTTQNTQTSHAAVEGAATAIAQASTRKHPPAPPRRRRVRQQFQYTPQRAPRAVARGRRVLYELKFRPATLSTRRLSRQELPTIGREIGRRQAGRCGRASHCGVLRGGMRASGHGWGDIEWRGITCDWMGDCCGRI